MTDSHTHYEATFGGLDYDEGDVPSGYRATVGATQGASQSFPTLRDVLRDMSDRFGIEARTAYYEDPERGFVEVPNRVVTVNPAWLGEGLADAPQNSAAWTTASDEYATLDAMDQFGPLLPMARTHELDDVFGHVRAYRNGGQVSLEVFFRGLTGDDPDTDEPRYILGFEGGFDYYLGQSLRATVIAYDTETGAVMRGLSERYSTPHRGDAEDRMAEWFDDMIHRAERVGQTLYQVVAEARDYHVNLNELPLDVREFYEAVGFPSSTVAKPAAELVRNARTPTAWELYEPVTLVLSREYDGKVGGSALRDHASRANELLYTPAKAEQAALRQAAEQFEDQETLLGEDDEDAADLLRRRAASLDEAVDSSLTFRQRVRTILAEAADEDDGESDEAEADEDEVAADGGFAYGEDREPDVVTDGGTDWVPALVQVQGGSLVVQDRESGDCLVTEATSLFDGYNPHEDSRMPFRRLASIFGPGVFADEASREAFAGEVDA